MYVESQVDFAFSGDAPTYPREGFGGASAAQIHTSNPAYLGGWRATPDDEDFPIQRRPEAPLAGIAVRILLQWLILYTRNLNRHDHEGNGFW